MHTRIERSQKWYRIILIDADVLRGVVKHPQPFCFPTFRSAYLRGPQLIHEERYRRYISDEEIEALEDGFNTDQSGFTIEPVRVLLMSGRSRIAYPVVTDPAEELRLQLTSRSRRKNLRS